jgi:membrane associated rhomboid family serine protease
MSFRGPGNSFQRNSPVVFYLIVANVAVFLAQKLLANYGVTEYISLHYFTSPAFKPHQIITSFFAHSPSLYTHILFNMFCLYTFGTMLERVWGSKKFFTFYMVCGVGASIVVLLSVPYSVELFMKSPEGIAKYANNIALGIESETFGYSALGASGAIMGVEAAFAYLFPNTELMLMFIPIPIKAKFVIPGFILLDLLGGFGYTGNDNIGHFAHLGGALVGFILVVYWNKTNKKTFY